MPFNQTGFKLYPFFLTFLIISASLLGTDLPLPSLSEQIVQGYSYLFEGKLEKAEAIFKGFQLDENPYIQNFGILGMAKIALEKKQFSEAEKLLNKIDRPHDNLIVAELEYEWIYTQGDLAFRQGRFDLAIEWLKKALPKKNEAAASWKPKTLSLLANAYLKQAETSNDPALKKEALKSAQNHFDELDPKEVDHLDSARFFIAKASLLNDYEILNPIHIRKSNLELKKDALMLLGDACSLGAIKTKDKALFLHAAKYYEEAGLPLKQSAALIQEGSETSLIQAECILDAAKEDPALKQLYKAELFAKSGETEKALAILEQEEFKAPFHETQLFLIGSLYLEKNEPIKASQAFQKLIARYPGSSLVPEALYWSRDYKTLYSKFPTHPLADEAYFHLYSAQDYLLGARAAIKHLHDFKTKFPNSPLLMHASYLEGLDYLHDRRSPEGKWIARENLIGAIDAFQNVETQYERLKDTQDLSSFEPLRIQAILERAKTNLKVAKDAKPAKKAIYLDYAEDVFTHLMTEIQKDDPLLEETLYFLALTQIQAGSHEKAIKTLNRLLSLSNDKGYFLALGLYQKGLLTDDTALFDQALAAGGLNFLSNDEILNIMIAKAEKYRKAGDLDKAMLQLSEVVNYSTASSLRIKAMFLRAEIYAEQGRKPLAQKQLESIAMKGGEWAIKAKEQLDKHYGYD